MLKYQKVPDTQIITGICLPVLKGANIKVQNVCILYGGHKGGENPLPNKC